MAINLPVQYEVQPRPQQHADKLWVLTLNVNANNPTESVKLSISAAPYVSATGEVLREHMQHIVVEDVLTACATNPTLAAALQAIYDAVEVLCEERGLFYMGEPPAEPPQE
jgi:hypothetical protein